MTTEYALATPVVDRYGFAVQAAARACRDECAILRLVIEEAQRALRDERMRLAELEGISDQLDFRRAELEGRPERAASNEAFVGRASTNKRQHCFLR